MSNTLLLTGPTLRRLVCLGATFSATTNPFPVLASPRARDSDSIEALLGGELGEAAASTPRVGEFILVGAGRVGDDAFDTRRLRQLGGAAGRPRAQETRLESVSYNRLPLELDLELLSTFDTLQPSARSTAGARDSHFVPAHAGEPGRSSVLRNIVGRKSRYSRSARTAALGRTSTLRVGTSLHPRPPSVRALSTLRPSSASKSPSLTVHDQGRADPGTPLPFLAPQTTGLAGGDVSARGVATGPTTEPPQGAGDVEDLRGERPVIPSKDPTENASHQQSALHVDELNTLLRHPALYDPILVPRHPIVLCHGLYGFDVRGPTFFRLHYWGDLLKILRGKFGAEVFVTAVPGTGAIKERAHVLHDALERTEGLLGRDLNFVAHSMGGLDARYLLSKIHPTTYNPRSLTTVSTPHRGSEFMTWCRANIGIGTDFDRTSEHAARLLHEDSSVPYSLKAPILSRAQVQAARDAADAAKQAKAAADKVKAANFPGLPYSLSTSLSGYLLDLLDSPAYANLTPSFLRDVFNPQTPDRPDIRYYSIAARTEKIGIWHPLWLPKVVLDGAEAARAANGILPEPRWRGNDGLVNVESAKWGEFLGVLENCDHWEVRGSSGLVNAVASAKAVAEATNIGSKEEVDEGRQAAKGSKSGWKWQDVYALVGIKSKESPSDDQAVAAKPAADESQASKDRKDDDDSSLAALASWIVHSLPGIPNPSTTAKATSKPPSSPLPAHHLSDSARDLTSSPLTGSPNPRLATTGPSDPGLQAARMLYGAPKSTVAPEKFNLERMALAICRKLHNEGL